MSTHDQPTPQRSRLRRSRSDGDWEPRDRLFSVRENRRRFMDVFAGLEPSVLESLRTVYDSLTKAGISWRYPDRPALLDEWGKRWWLRDPWCHDWAIERFREWENLPPRWDTESIESLLERWQKAGGTPPFGGVPPVASFVPTQVRWAMAIEGERVFRERALNQFRRELKAYIEECQRSALAARARPIRRKRQETHFYWLARFQLGEKVADVARHHAHLKPAAFYNAIKRTAKELGLTRRPRR